MTITYHAGRRIQGLSTDTVETPSLDYNFPNTTNWTSADSFTDGTISSNKLNYTGDSSTNSSLSFDMENATTGIGETVSDTAWVLRFGLQIVSWVNATSDKVRLGIGMSSADSSTGYSSAQDHICINLQADNDGSERVYTDWANNNSMESNQVRTSSDFTATQYYVELIRTSSSTFTMQFYSDSDYTTTVSGINASRTGITDVTGLRYFVVKNYTDASTDGNIVLKISDLQFWNGVSSLTSKPTNVQSGSRFEETDTRKIYYGALSSVTYETDFSSTTGWSLNGGSYTGISNGVYNWDILTGLNNEVRGAWYPITTADDSKWVLRFKLGIDTLTPSGSPDPDSSQLIVILSDTGANTYYPYDAIGFSFYLGGGGSWAPKFYLWGSDSYYIISPSSTAVTAYTTTPSTGTYYIELIRNSSTSVTGTIYSDSNYSTVVESKTITIPSTIQSLDNIQICVFDGNNSGSYTANGYIDDLKFYNGVTSTGFTWTEEV